MATPSDATIAAAVVSGVGGALTTVLGYWWRARSTSGTVSTSTADQLWDEMNRHLERLDETVARQAERIGALELSLIQRDEKIVRLEAEKERLTVRVNDLETELAKVNERAAAAADALRSEHGGAA